MRASHGPLPISKADKIALSAAQLANIRCPSQPPVRPRRPFCPFESVLLERAMHPMACTQRYTVQFPNSHTAVLTAHALLTVCHAALAGRATLTSGRIDPSVLQHCLVDCTQRISTLWRKARLMKHITRVKYGGILAVAYDERRRLVIDRTIRKWRNSALRYRAASMWQYDSQRSCRSVRPACSRAFTAWVFHVSERHRLCKVRAFVSRSLLESHASPELAASIYP